MRNMLRFMDGRARIGWVDGLLGKEGDGADGKTDYD